MWLTRVWTVELYLDPDFEATAPYFGQDILSEPMFQIKPVEYMPLYVLKVKIIPFKYLVQSVPGLTQYYGT